MKSPVPAVEHTIGFRQLTVGLLLYAASTTVYMPIIKHMLKNVFKGSTYSSIPVLNSNEISQIKLLNETLFVDLIFL